MFRFNSIPKELDMEMVDKLVGNDMEASLACPHFLRQLWQGRAEDPVASQRRWLGHVWRCWCRRLQSKFPNQFLIVYKKEGIVDCRHDVIVQGTVVTTSDNKFYVNMTRYDLADVIKLEDLKELAVSIRGKKDKE